MPLAGVAHIAAFPFISEKGPDSVRDIIHGKHCYPGISPVSDSGCSAFLSTGNIDSIEMLASNGLAGGVRNRVSKVYS